MSIHTLNIISHSHVHRYIQHFPTSQLRWLGSSYDLSLLQVKKRKEDPFVSESLFPKIDHEFLAMSSHQQHELLCFGEAARKVMARQDDGNLDQRGRSSSFFGRIRFVFGKSEVIKALSTAHQMHLSILALTSR